MMLAMYIILGLLIFILLKKDEGALANNEKSKCINCGKEIDDEAQYCHHCGEKLKKKCGSCGKLIETNWRECPFCGHTEINKNMNE